MYSLRLIFSHAFIHFSLIIAFQRETMQQDKSTIHIEMQLSASQSLMCRCCRTICCRESLAQAGLWSNLCLMRADEWICEFSFSACQMAVSELFLNRIFYIDFSQEVKPLISRKWQVKNLPSSYIYLHVQACCMFLSESFSCPLPARHCDVYQ